MTTALISENMNKISGPRIYLRDIELSDVNDTYLGWLHDEDVTRYLEIRFQDVSLESLEDFVGKSIDAGDISFFAIIVKGEERHIGNIKIGPVDRNHLLADVGVIIGEKDCWGKGYASEAIGLAAEFAFNRLGLHKLTAGCYAGNEGSLRAFMKCGFEIEGIRKAHCICDGRYVDVHLMGRINPTDGDEK